MALLVKPLEYDCLRVCTSCVVDAKEYEKFKEAPEYVECTRADWDTGATVTIISESIVKQLGLIPIGKTKISGYNGKPAMTNEYRIDLVFDNGVKVEFVRVAEAPLVTMDLLIGMNVINQGDFRLNFRNGKREFTFEVD